MNNDQKQPFNPWVNVIQKQWKHPKFYLPIRLGLGLGMGRTGMAKGRWNTFRARHCVGHSGHPTLYDVCRGTIWSYLYCCWSNSYYYHSHFSNALLVIHLILTVAYEDIAILLSVFPLHRGGNCSSEKLSNLLKFAQLLSNGPGLEPGESSSIYVTRHSPMLNSMSWSPLWKKSPHPIHHLEYNQVHTWVLRSGDFPEAFLFSTRSLMVEEELCYSVHVR